MERRDLMWVATLAIAGAIGLGVFVQYFEEALPVASVDFKLSREEAFTSAEGFLSGLGYDLETYDHAQKFASQEESQIYLERTLGLTEANRLAGDWVSVWSWAVRWFKPLQKEELSVQLDPGGRVTHFQHLLLDDAAGDSLSQDEAREIATIFLTGRLAFDLAQWEEIEASTTERPARIDHEFTFRMREFEIGEGGHYRASVQVKGSEVGGFGEYLHVPEAFKRDYSEVRSRADLLGQFMSVFWLLLFLAVIVVAAQHNKAGTLSWNTSLRIGTVAAAAAALGALNTLPLNRFAYDPTDSYVAFLTTLVVAGLVGALLLGGTITLVGTSGQAMARSVFGGDRHFQPLNRRTVVSPSFATSVFAGYGLAGCMLGYLVAFYLIGSRYFGVWSPAYLVDYDNAFSTAMPWIYPLLTGLLASTMEEFFFRLFAIPLLLRWFKRTWIAVLIPAIVWGFLHSNYPVEPIYTRGIELTVVGCVFGLVFLRFGIWSTVVAHYAYNAFVSGWPMLQSTSLYFQVSGLAVILILLVPGILAVVMRGRAAVEEAESDAEPGPESEPAAGSVLEFPAEKPVNEYILTSGQRWIAAAFCCTGLVLWATFQTPPFASDTLRVSVDRVESMRIADEVMASLGWDAAGYMTYSNYWDGLPTPHHSYLVRQVGSERAAALLDSLSLTRRWGVRYFKPLEKREYGIALHPDGRLGWLRQDVPEDAPGASLTKEQAREVAEGFLRQRFGLEMADTLAYSLYEHKVDQRASRVDHEVRWERLGPKVGDGKWVITVGVKGDAIGYYRPSFKAPESFLREQQETSTIDAVSASFGGLAFIATAALMIIFLFRAHRDSGLDWRAGLTFGLVILGCQILGFLNALPQFTHGFATSQSYWTMMSSRGMSRAMMILAISGGLGLVVVYLGAILRDQVPSEWPPARWCAAVMKGEGGSRLLWDILLSAAALSLVTYGIASLRDSIRDTYFPEFANASAFSPSSVDDYIPALGVVISRITALGGPLLAICALLTWRRAVHRWWIVCLLVVLVLVGPGVRNAESGVHGLVLAATYLLQAALMIFLIARVVRYNLPAYLVYSWWAAIPAAVMLSKTDVSYYVTNGVLLLLVTSGPILFALWRQFTPHRRSPDPA